MILSSWTHIYMILNYHTQKHSKPLSHKTVQNVACRLSMLVIVFTAISNTNISRRWRVSWHQTCFILNDKKLLVGHQLLLDGCVCGTQHLWCWKYHSLINDHTEWYHVILQYGWFTITDDLHILHLKRKYTVILKFYP